MTIPQNRLSSGISWRAYSVRQDLFRLPAGRSNIEGVRAQVDLTGPNDCTALATGYSVKGIPVGPRLKDASSGQIAEIHDAFNAIFVLQPEAESVQGTCMNRFLQWRPLLPILERSRLYRAVPIASASIRLSLHLPGRHQLSWVADARSQPSRGCIVPRQWRAGPKDLHAGMARESTLLRHFRPDSPDWAFRSTMCQ